MKKEALFLLLVCCGVTNAMAQGDARVGQRLSQQCAACHGAQGIPSMAGIPTIAGQTKEELFNALVAYQNGTSQGSKAFIMKSQVSRFSLQQLDDLATYYSQLPAEK